MNEFNLSEKIWELHEEALCYGDCIQTKDVKEFIRRLKEKVDLLIGDERVVREDVKWEIEKLAGDDLK